MNLILFTLLVIYNGVDVYQTWQLMQLGVPEWNPVLVFYIDIYGFFPAVIGIKTLFLLILGLGMVVKDSKQ